MTTPAVEGPVEPLLLASPYIAVVMIVLLMMFASGVITAQLKMYGRRDWRWVLGFSFVVGASLISIVLGYQALGDMVMRPAIVGGDAETMCRIEAILTFACSLATVYMWMFKDIA